MTEQNILLGVQVLLAFEKVWDAKVKEIEGCLEKGERKPTLLDFSNLNLLSLQIQQMSELLKPEEIYEIFEKTPGEISKHKKYFEYARINARYINQDSEARIAEIIRKNQN